MKAAMTSKIGCSKEEAASALVKAGYPAAVVDGVVMIDNSKQLTEKEIQKIRILFCEINYHARWGCNGWCK